MAKSDPSILKNFNHVFLYFEFKESCLKPVSIGFYATWMPVVVSVSYRMFVRVLAEIARRSAHG
jgi:hypothetical protein